jgi:hypothetical protein
LSIFEYYGARAKIAKNKMSLTHLMGASSRRGQVLLLNKQNGFCHFLAVHRSIRHKVKINPRICARSSWWEIFNVQRAFCGGELDV